MQAAKESNLERASEHPIRTQVSKQRAVWNARVTIQFRGGAKVRADTQVCPYVRTQTRRGAECTARTCVCALLPSGRPKHVASRRPPE